MLETCDKHNSVIYDFVFIKCVFRQSENAVRFENLMGIGFQTGQILWDFISNRVRYGMYGNGALEITTTSASKIAKSVFTNEPWHVISNNVAFLQV